MVSKDRIVHTAENIFQIILAIFIVLVLWEVLKGDVDSKHSWHVICSVLGVALCMAEGVQIFRKESNVTYGDTRSDKSKIHLLVMCLAFICVTIGISLKINEIEDFNGSHFTSTHGILGLTAWILAFLTAIGGLLASDFIDLNISHRIRKCLHIILGVSTYVIAIFALGFGLEYLVPTNGRIFLYILLAIYSIYSLIGPGTSLLNFVKS